MKTCNKCGEAKPLEAFNARRGTCTPCRVAYNREQRRGREDELKAYRRAHYEANRDDYIRRAVTWQRENADRYRQRVAEWYANNPDARSKRAQYAKARRARLAEATVVDFTPSELEQRLSMFAGKCGICREQITELLEVDHIIPLAAGGPHMLSNLQPAHQYCNRSKGATRPSEEAA